MVRRRAGAATGVLRLVEKYVGYPYLPTNHNGEFSVAIRAVYWQEPGDKIHITIHWL